MFPAPLQLCQENRQAADEFVRVDLQSFHVFVVVVASRSTCNDIKVWLRWVVAGRQHIKQWSWRIECIIAVCNEISSISKLSYSSDCNTFFLAHFVRSFSFLFTSLITSFSSSALLSLSWLSASFAKVSYVRIFLLFLELVVGCALFFSSTSSSVFRSF